MEDFTGMQLGRYKLVEELSKSEVTRLFKAYDTRLERHVALKLVTHSQEYSQEFIDHFFREARALAQLSHPNIVTVLDFGQEGGFLFLVMEYITGETLAEQMGMAIEWQEAISMLMPVAEALEYAHDRNVIHRGLKPANILLNAENQPVISDFSLARMIEEEATREMTGTNVGLGSPYYISPEQGKGLPIDSRADIYAFGLILYEMVTGRRPFEAENGMEVVIQQVSAKLPNPRKFIPSLPDVLEKILLTALQKDPDERFQSMGELIQALKGALESGESSTQTKRGSWTARRWAITISVGVVMIALITSGALWLAGRRQEQTTPERTALAAASSGPAARNGPTSMPTVAEPTKASGAATQTVTVAQEEPTPTKQVAVATKPAATPTTTGTTPGETSTANEFPEYPAIQGQKIPKLDAVITQANAAQISEVGRFGYPRIHALTWSADEQTLFGATSAGAYLYNTEQIQAKAFFDGKGWLTAIAKSSDEAWIATGDSLGMVRIWDARTGKEKLALAGHTGPISALDFSPNGTRLVSASVDKTARVWDTSNGQTVAALSRHQMAVSAAVFSPDGKMIITGSKDFHAMVWNAETGERVGDFRSDSMIYDLALSGDGKTLAVALGNAQVDIFDLEKKKKDRTIRDKSQVEEVVSLDLSPNGQLLATGSADSMLRVWNVSSGQLIWQINAAMRPGADATVAKAQANIADPVEVVSFSKSARLVTATQNGTVIIWDTNGQPLANNFLGWVGIRRLGLSPDGKILAVQAGNQGTATWSVPNGTPLGRYEGDIPRGSVFSQDSQTMALQSGDKMDLYNVSQPVGVKRKSLTLPPANISVSFLEKDRMVGAASAQGISLWSTNSGFELNAGSEKRQSRCKVYYSEDGRYVAAGSGAGLFTNEAATPFFCQANRGLRVKDEAFSSDGKYLAFALDNGQVELWVNEKDAKARYFQAAKGKVLGIAFSPDSSLLATADEDGSVKIWNPATMEWIVTLAHHTGAVNDVVFSADGKMLITGSEDGTFEIWGLYQPSQGG